MSRTVAFIADSIDNAPRFQQALSQLNVSVSAGSTVQMAKMLEGDSRFDLVIFEACRAAAALLPEAVALAEDKTCPLLVIAEEADLSDLALSNAVPCDFVVSGAGVSEIAARVRRLLFANEGGEPTECIVVDNMVINLATYQVTINSEPVDLTYLEYALLSFLAKHPGHTFSRDALLQRVWGFDYYGGSRTVDVHVRRIRAKLGPDLAQRLETVRGVGYLWNA